MNWHKNTRAQVPDKKIEIFTGKIKKIEVIFSALWFFRHFGLRGYGIIFGRYRFYIFGPLVSALGPRPE